MGRKTKCCLNPKWFCEVKSSFCHQSAIEEDFFFIAHYPDFFPFVDQEEMDKVDKSVLVWPWSQNLTYHSLLDTFVNSCVPSEPRCLFPDSCSPDPNNTELQPDPSLPLSKNLSVGGQNLNVSLTVITSTGMEKTYDDHIKARVDRSRLGLNLSYATCDRIVVMVMPDEPEDISLVCLWLCSHFINFKSFTTFVIAKQLQTVPTYFVCIDDPTFRIGKSVQKTVCTPLSTSLPPQCMAALANYGKDWSFKTISSTASVAEVEQLFSQIIADSAAPKPAASTGPSAGAKKTGGRRGGGGCTLL